MNVKDYMHEALFTESSRTGLACLTINEVRLLHAAIGLCTESGEFMDAMKKAIFYGARIDKLNLVEELGDLLWYMALALDAIGSNFEEAMAANVAKLHKRYPDKYSDRAATERNVKQEIAAMLEQVKSLKEELQWEQAAGAILTEPGASNAK